MAAERSLIYSQLFSQRSHYALVIEYKSRKVPSLSTLTPFQQTKRARHFSRQRARARGSKNDEIQLLKDYFIKVKST